MYSRQLILIDDQDQRSVLKKIANKLRQNENIDLGYKQINPSLAKYQKLSPDDDSKFTPNLEEILKDVKEIDGFYSAEAIAIDYNLTEALTGLELAIAIRSLGYNTKKQIFIYSANIDDAINKILEDSEISDQKILINKLVKGNFFFATRGDDFADALIGHIKKVPPFDFDGELTKWLYQFGDLELKPILECYQNDKLGKIADEILNNTGESKKFRKELIEMLFSMIIEIHDYRGD